jgi:hypothetical protein
VGAKSGGDVSRSRKTKSSRDTIQHLETSSAAGKLRSGAAAKTPTEAAPWPQQTKETKSRNSSRDTNSSRGINVICRGASATGAPIVTERRQWQVR